MDVLQELQEWYNNSDAVSNTVQVLNLLITIIFIWVITWLKKKARNLLLNDKQKVPEEKIDLLIENQIKNNNSIQSLNQMIMKFSLSTSIDAKDKEELFNLYQDIKSNTIELTNKSKQIIESTVEKAKEIIEDTKVKVGDVKKESKSIIDKYREELK